MPLWSFVNEAHVRVFWYLRDNQMYPDDAETADFSACADFSVVRMQYWNKGFESSDIFYRKCETVAKGMGRYFRENRAEYETTVNRDAVLANLSVQPPCFSHRTPLRKRVLFRRSSMQIGR